jgi:hypothetical protein
MRSPDKSHYFIDGTVGRSGTLGLVAYPNALKGTDTEFTTFYMTNIKRWGHQTCNFDGRSTTGTLEDGRGSWWVLGKRGEVMEMPAVGENVQSQITDAGTGRGRYGYVNKIANIAGSLYVCGYARQVYRREVGAWVHVDQGMIADVNATGISLESIDGLDESNMYAVGLKGEIWHFDGRTWTPVDSPTNVHLFEVHCVNAELVYACGKDGVVVRGSGSRWEVLQNPDFNQDLWGVCAFEGEIYVAGFGGLARVDGTDIVPLDTGLGRKIPGYRLRAGPPGVLWSIGNDDILRFDGSKWEEVICPDNK